MSSASVFYSDVETLGALTRMRETAFVYGTREFAKGTDDAILKDYLENLKEKELRRKTWKPNSPQLKFRKAMIDHLIKLCMAEELTAQTIYLAIYYLDRFMMEHDIQKCQLATMIVVCVVVAGKLIEVNREIPGFRELSRYLHGSPRSVFVKTMTAMELYLLKSFNYSIMHPTEVTFLEVYLMYAVDGMRAIDKIDTNNNDNQFEDANPSAAADSLPSTAAAAESSYGGAGVVEVDPENGLRIPASALPEAFPAASVPSRELIDDIRGTAFLMLQELTLVTVSSIDSNSPPSLIAAAILMGARREHGLNYWTSNLQNLTNVTVEEVNACLVKHVEPYIKRAKLEEPFEPAQFLKDESDIFLFREDEEGDDGDDEDEDNEDYHDAENDNGGNNTNEDTEGGHENNGLVSKLLLK